MIGDFPFKTTFEELITKGDLQIGDGYRAKNNELGGNGIIFLRAGHVNDRGIDFSGADRLNDDVTANLEAKTSKAGDTIVTTKGNSTGRSSFVEEWMPEFVYSPHLSFWRSGNQDTIDNGFLRYWSKSKEFLDQLNGMKVSTDMAPYLSLTDQRRLQITLTSIQEQRFASQILSTLDDKIELNRKTNETLEGIAKALFKSWFVDFDPVRAKAEGRPTGLPDEISELFPDSFEESELGEIPSGWSIGEVGDFLDLERDSVTPSDSGEEMFDHYSIPAYDEGLTPSCEAGQSIKSNKYLITDGVFMVSKLNPRFPRIWVPSKHTTRRRICSTEFLVCRPKVKINAPFVLHVTKSRSVVQQMSDLASGTSNSHQRVRPADFVGLPFVKPSAALVKLYSEMVGPMLEKHLLTRDENQALSKTRDTLLPRLISGELRVPDAEKMLEEVGI